MVLKHDYVLVGAVSQKMLRRHFTHYVYVLKGMAGNLNKAIGGPPRQVTSYISPGHKLETLFSYNLELCTEQVPSPCSPLTLQVQTTCFLLSEPVKALQFHPHSCRSLLSPLELPYLAIQLGSQAQMATWCLLSHQNVQECCPQIVVRTPKYVHDRSYTYLVLKWVEKEN